MSRGLLLSLIVVLAAVVPAVITMDRGLAPVGEREEPARARPAVSQAAAARPAQKPRSRPAPATEDFQIAAGSVIVVTLRTTVGSATSAAGDQVDAELAESLSRDGKELIPAGSTMRGTVADALPASRDSLRGRVAIAFFVIEHLRTGSRAAIKTRPIAIDASPPADKRPIDVRLAAGHRMHVVLAEPLLVRIPK